MSGGHFEYRQWNIQDIADRLEDYIYGHELDEEDIDEYVHDTFYFRDDADKKEAEKYVRENKHTLPNLYGYSEETIAEFKRGLDILRKAYVYAQRIDWLLSGDDGEDSFHERLKEELEKLNKPKSDGED